MELRSNFEPGTTRWAVRRTQWKSMGIADADMEKPKIAVINTSNKLSSCFIHVDKISQAVQNAIKAAGGVPFEVRTVASSDFVTSAGKKARYLMPTRDLIVNEVECMVEGAVLDGIVFLSSCDKTTPAHCMAAARLLSPACRWIRLTLARIASWLSKACAICCTTFARCKNRALNRWFALILSTLIRRRKLPLCARRWKRPGLALRFPSIG